MSEILVTDLTKTDVAASTSKVELDEYLKMAKAAGIEDSSVLVTAAQLEYALQEENIQIYDLAQVEKFLDKEFKGWWAWIPLRRVDRGNCRKAGHAFGFLACHYGGRIGGENVVYNKPVPLPVLETVKKILTHCPTARFFVSDNQEPMYRDPFLLVTLENYEKYYVIERWDEPNFRHRVSG